MYARVVSCFKVALLRLTLVVSVLAVAVCWAVVFIGYLLLVGLGRLIPERFNGRPAPRVRVPSDLPSEETHSTA